MPADAPPDRSALFAELGAHLRTNGLMALLAGFNDAGEDAATQSWLGNTPNQPIVGDDVKRALGRDALEAMAGHLGTSPDQVADALARVIPTVVDVLTPGGNLPDGPTLHSLDLPAALTAAGVDPVALLG